MAEEHEIVKSLEELIRKILPTSHTVTPPQKISIGMFDGGRGMGVTYKGESVNFVCHPQQLLSPGDVAIGVPVGPGLFFIVGKVS